MSVCYSATVLSPAVQPGPRLLPADFGNAIICEVPVSVDVSVVIPTRHRPDLVTRAVRSALAQTIADIEVVVVVDGPDDATAAALAGLDDARLRVVVLARKAGAPHARNVGVRAARAPWTALLDDDDEWLPHKLAAQLELAKRSAVAMPVIATRLINRTPRAESVLPRRLPAPGEPLSEYLTVRRGPVLRRRVHPDLDDHGADRAAAPGAVHRRPAAPAGTRLDAAGGPPRRTSTCTSSTEPLVIWHQDEDRPRISLESPWPQQLGVAAAQPPSVHPAGVRGVHDECAQLDGGADAQRGGLSGPAARGPSARPSRSRSITSRCCRSGCCHRSFGSDCETWCSGAGPARHGARAGPRAIGRPADVGKPDPAADG